MTLELLPFILKALLPKYRTMQPTRTETITTITGTVPELVVWKNQKTQEMIDRAAKKPTIYTISKDAKPLSTQSQVVTNAPSKRYAIGGGPPMTTTTETITYSTGPARRIRVN